MIRRPPEEVLLAVRWSSVAHRPVRALPHALDLECWLVLQPSSKKPLRRTCLLPRASSSSCLPSWVTDWPLAFKKALTSVVVISGGFFVVAYATQFCPSLQGPLHRAACLLLKRTIRMRSSPCSCGKSWQSTCQILRPPRAAPLKSPRRLRRRQQRPPMRPPPLTKHPKARREPRRRRL